MLTARVLDVPLSSLGPFDPPSPLITKAYFGSVRLGGPDRARPGWVGSYPMTTSQWWKTEEELSYSPSLPNQYGWAGPIINSHFNASPAFHHDNISSP
ncbi:hypothetical protein Sjap_020956 [Stephania japonica]|uniref:Uncharacterized protein n=1 Tax=Stephania japonica TaxID=461633 RepID=A0AAP0F4E8_9MAGN